MEGSLEVRRQLCYYVAVDVVNLCLAVCGDVDF